MIMIVIIVHEILIRVPNNNYTYHREECDEIWNSVFSPKLLMFSVPVSKIRPKASAHVYVQIPAWRKGTNYMIMMYHVFAKVSLFGREIDSGAPGAVTVPDRTGLELLILHLEWQWFIWCCCLVSRLTYTWGSPADISSTTLGKVKGHGAASCGKPLASAYF